MALAQECAVEIEFDLARILPRAPPLPAPPQRSSRRQEMGIVAGVGSALARRAGGNLPPFSVNFCQAAVAPSSANRLARLCKALCRKAAPSPWSPRTYRPPDRAGLIQPRLDPPRPGVGGVLPGAGVLV